LSAHAAKSLRRICDKAAAIREGEPVPIIPEATIVPAGVVRLVELRKPAMLM
jgi:hypothetical protein